jgi:hypothetical protein
MPFLLRGLAATGALAVSTATLTGLALPAAGLTVPAATAQAATRCYGPEAMVTFADGSYICQGLGIRQYYPPNPGQAVTSVCAGGAPAIVTVLPPIAGLPRFLVPGQCGTYRDGDPVLVTVG